MQAAQPGRARRYEGGFSSLMDPPPACFPPTPPLSPPVLAEAGK